jgi:hypothetical protein
MEIMYYPKIFAASDMEPSTANSRSNKACIPCPVINKVQREVFKYVNSKDQGQQNPHIMH